MVYNDAIQCLTNEGLKVLLLVVISLEVKRKASTCHSTTATTDLQFAVLPLPLSIFLSHHPLGQRLQLLLAFVTKTTMIGSRKLSVETNSCVRFPRWLALKSL